ncbi:MAG: polysaccharide biosynthesis tyrosine autokinase [Prevotella sp.]|nr:polysaccharide biosynthesis tyrosine autokinase [Prevotella sp.]
MEENKTLDLKATTQVEEESSVFDFQVVYRTIILNWMWFLLSLIICLGAAALYLRYKTPTYQANAKFLIKDDDDKGYRRGNSSTLQGMTTLGLISSSNGFDNEMEILQSHTLAQQVVRDLKLYVSYTSSGRLKDHLYYKIQPINVDIDAAHLEKLNAPIRLTISRNGSQYEIEGTYYVPINDEAFEGPYTIKKKISTLPSSIPTRAGVITLAANGTKTLVNGDVLKVTILSPKQAAYKYRSSLSVSPTSKTTTIAQLQLVDEIPQRAIDYLRQLAIAYNRQANEDKNEVATLTEKFINSRLAKINTELGQTEGELENYKQRNDMVELKMNATQSLANQTKFEQELNDIETQIELLNSISDFMNESNRTFQVLPSNVGLTDPSSTQLIAKYNDLVLERNRLLRSASENSPVVEPITEQIKELNQNIRRAISQSRRGLEIKRQGIAAQYRKYNVEIAQTPQQERMLTQIGRQQEVKSGLYLMLLQKREENSISLAATADKGKLIDDPQFAGKVSPKSPIVMLIGLILGIALPAIIIFLLRFFRYKIEGHEDVASLTKLPILADVAVASETAKTKADIVVHENKNNQMEEIFRSMRTNLQFMLKEGQKVVMFTSTTSGEGKTFNCANLAVSFALLGKKAIIVGLDIRKPRLAELFEINDHHHGITPLLIKEAPTYEEIKAQILPSGVNKNLDLLMAGPIPPNPAELMARNSLETIFNHLREHYDYILVDTAPVGLVTDTLQIGRVSDATIYMCRADFTPKDSFELINGLAGEGKLPNMAVVINGIDMSKKKYGYYYGYGRYGKYGRYGRYGRYGYGKYGRYGSYGSYGHYGTYGSYGNYANSHYGNKKDTSIKR